MDLGSPTVWKSPAMVSCAQCTSKWAYRTEWSRKFSAGDVQPNDKIVTGVEQRAELDFVTGFVSKLTGKQP